MTVLKVEALSMQFGGLRAVSDLNWTARGGEVLGLIGPNGAGKTTVFNLVTGFITPTGGTVRLDDRSLDGLSPEARCEAGVVRTFQIVKPFRDISVIDNVVIGAMLRAPSLKAARRKAMAVLDRVGLAHLTSVNARTLPVGDRKRLELAKALATEPRALLLDEVMGGLIPIEAQRLIALIRDLARDGLAIVLIEHNMSAIMQLSDRILVLHHGERIAEGTPSEVSGDRAVLEAYLGHGFELLGARAR